MSPGKKPRRWRWIRLSVQILVLALFLYLLVGNRVGAASLPGDLFFHFDPLTGLASMLASRSFMAPMLLGFLTIGLTLAVGRAWCSWICPLGTLLDWTSLRRRFRNPPGHPSHWRQVKYLGASGRPAGGGTGYPGTSHPRSHHPPFPHYSLQA